MSKLEEFFLKGRKDVVYIETIEIIHAHFTQPLRIVRNVTSGWVAKLATADTERVKFEYFPLKLEMGSSKTDLDQSLNITVGDLGEVLPQELERAFGNTGILAKPVLKYRCYASDDPDYVLYGPITLQIDKFSYDEQGTTFVATAPNVNSSKTGELFSTIRFPYLRSLL